MKLVALILADHADADGICWPSYRRIAERACLSERTVRRHVSALVDAGVLQKVRTGGVVTREGERVWVSNQYRIEAEALAGLPSLLKAVTGDHLGRKVVRGDPLEVVADGHPRWSAVSTKPSEQPSERTVIPSLVLPDRFEEFWTVWPQRKGSKKLAQSRFNALSAEQQEQCLAAARHFAEGFKAGLVEAPFQPRAENFIGGAKSYWLEWKDGVPEHLASARRLGSAFGGLREVARDLEAEEVTQ